MFVKREGKSPEEKMTRFLLKVKIESGEIIKRDIIGSENRFKLFIRYVCMHDYLLKVIHQW